MLNRRKFLTRSLQSASLLTLSSAVPQFIARTAMAAEAGKENILVVVEMNGGNDGLNTVIPYADDLYPKFRSSLRQTKNEVVKVNDHIGLNSGMAGLTGCSNAANWPSFRASAIPTRSGRTSSRWTFGSQPTRVTRRRLVGSAAASTSCTAPPAAFRSCTSAPRVCRWRSRRDGRSDKH